MAMRVLLVHATRRACQLRVVVDAKEKRLAVDILCRGIVRIGVGVHYFDRTSRCANRHAQDVRCSWCV